AESETIGADHQWRACRPRDAARGGTRPPRPRPHGRAARDVRGGGRGARRAGGRGARRRRRACRRRRRNAQRGRERAGRHQHGARPGAAGHGERLRAADGDPDGPRGGARARAGATRVAHRHDRAERPAVRQRLDGGARRRGHCRDAEGGEEGARRAGVRDHRDAQAHAARAAPRAVRRARLRAPVRLPVVRGGERARDRWGHRAHAARLPHRRPARPVHRRGDAARRVHAAPAEAQARRAPRPPGRHLPTAPLPDRRRAARDHGECRWGADDEPRADVRGAPARPPRPPRELARRRPRTL
ncbi:MAG: hypothetical protein AVDCRST_MAG11-92, partial [uncultured Gemmatimonadaceae bacterium]